MTGVIRLQASVPHGKFKRVPVWTAFITHQIDTPGWISFDHSKVVSLMDLQLYIFTAGYIPGETPTGGFELKFSYSEGTVTSHVHLESLLTESDARDFITAVETLKEVSKNNAKQEQKP